jgi:hypothetical protein
MARANLETTNLDGEVEDMRKTTDPIFSAPKRGNEVGQFVDKHVVVRGVVRGEC